MLFRHQLQITLGRVSSVGESTVPLKSSTVRSDLHELKDGHFTVSFSQIQFFFPEQLHTHKVVINVDIKGRLSEGGYKQLRDRYSFNHDEKRPGNQGGVICVYVKQHPTRQLTIPFFPTSGLKSLTRD